MSPMIRLISWHCGTRFAIVFVVIFGTSPPPCPPTSLPTNHLLPLVGSDLLVGDVHCSMRRRRNFFFGLSINQPPLVGSDVLGHNDALPTTPWSVTIFDWFVDKGRNIPIALMSVPCPKGRDVYKKPEGYYSAPLYKTIERRGNISSLGQSTNFILAVELPVALPS
jgi:hypothetical protein